MEFLAILAICVVAVLIEGVVRRGYL